MPIQVYLDSSDYSKLTDPRGVSDQLLSIKERLLSWSKSGEVTFRFSAAHIIEMSPVESKAEHAAEARAEFLSELCGLNTLIPFDELTLAELKRYASNEPNLKIDAYSDKGNWFPSLGEGIFSVLGEDRLSPSNFLPKLEGLSRDARRKAEREIFKNGKLREEAKRKILAEADDAIRAILAQFPMRKQDADVLVRYMVGDATKAKADNAFYASLRDPNWMMQWFRNQRDPMMPIIEWLRAPARRLQASMVTASNASQQLRKVYKDNGSNSIPPELSAKAREEMRLRWLQSISISIMEAKQVAAPPFDLTRIQDLAPGFCTGISVSNDTLWASASENPRESMPSDFVDAVHSMYAPYVDVYRTDAFMTPLVSKYVKSRGTVVVGKITSLIETIEFCLQRPR
ncbi:hypothetical protein [Duganella radicis]|uniref:Uncharacterized protein n=1 Tax=Duganella radicis TaxID=551988 RepID=A0A6L6PKN2_9BURK|nr:hypothetical protein [Duganella radicis]MTV39512.1 hypothetical protein [Duganella radicis]